MKEFILMLMQAVIAAAVPVCAAYFVGFLKKKSAQAQAQTENIKTKELMEQVTDAVCTAVTYTSQTFVDALKRTDGFTKDAQNEALRKSLRKAEELLSPVAINALHDLYGSAEDYLISRIEAEVRNQKIAVTGATA